MVKIIMKKHRYPFIKKFSDHNGNYYIYDVHTNRIVEVNKIVYDIINFFDINSNDVIINKAQKLYDRKNLETAVTEIYSYITNHGIFLSDRPRVIEFGLSYDELKEKLENEVKGLTLNVTNNCNLSCRYCPYNEDNMSQEMRPKINMEKDVALAAIDFFFRHNQRARKENIIVSFYGGEPILNFEVIKACVEYVKSKYKDFCNNTHFIINTNGTLLDEDVISYLVTNNKVFLHISLDGPEAVHDGNRIYKDGSGTFKTIVRNLERIRQKDINYYENCIALKPVIAPPFDLISLDNFFFENSEKFLKIDDSKIFFNYVFTYKIKYLNGFDIKKLKEKLRKQQNFVFGSFIRELTEKGFAKPSLGRKLMLDMLYKIYRRNYYSGLPEKWVFRSFCVPGGLKPFIDVDGKVGICESTGCILDIGNIYNDYDLEKIISIINKVMKICNKECRACWAIRFCNVCFAWLIYNDEIDLNKMHIMCSALKKALVRSFLWYVYILKRNPKSLESLC